MNLGLHELRLANIVRSEEWMGHTPRPEDLMFCAVELGGETGEALNKVKKYERHRLGVRGGDPDLQPLCDELADVIICVDRVAAALNIDLAAAVRHKFNQTSDKYGLSTQL